VLSSSAPLPSSAPAVARGCCTGKPDDHGISDLVAYRYYLFPNNTNKDLAALRVVNRFWCTTALGEWLDSWMLPPAHVLLRVCLPLPSSDSPWPSRHDCPPAMDRQRLHRTVPEARADQTTTSDPAGQIIPASFARCSTGAIATISFLSDIQSRRGALLQRPSPGSSCAQRCLVSQCIGG
jgi:hypothetical protein